MIHFRKGETNIRGLLLVSCFIFIGLILMLNEVRLGFDPATGCKARIFHVFKALLLTISVITPTFGAFKPGFTFKGKPGINHSPTLISGILLVLAGAIFLVLNLRELGETNLLILNGVIIPLHGIHAIAVYSSYFKGPTSRFGKIYQPHLPIVE